MKESSNSLGQRAHQLAPSQFTYSLEMSSCLHRWEAV